ncbi:MAG TPA: hypothetical protein VF843_04650 [Streptosporangiaceae bacterium]
MSAGWVAGSVRARALARRRIGPQEARKLAACRSLDEALARLAASPYRIGPAAGQAGRRDRPLASPGSASHEEVGALEAAQNAIADGLLWDLRVLTGWLPQGGAQLMRTLAGWYEIANVSERVAELSGRPPGHVFRLGALATAWPKLRQAGSRTELRSVLAASAWKDPGGDSAAALQIGMRARWAQRVAALGEPAQTWAASGLALLLAGERAGAEGQDGAEWPAEPRNPVLTSAAAAVLGPRAARAASLTELAASLPARLSWVLKPARDAALLWQGEVGWWARIERDGRDLLAGSGLDRRPVLGAVAVLACDARRVGAALEMAARGGGPLEVFDAVA